MGLLDSLLQEKYFLCLILSPCAPFGILREKCDLLKPA